MTITRFPEMSLTKEEVIKALSMLPEQIAAQEVKLHTLSSNVVDLQEDVEWLGLALEKKALDNPENTNDKLRKNAYKELLKSDEEYLDAKDAVTVAQDKASQSQITLRLLNNRFAAAKSLSRLLSIQED